MGWSQDAALWVGIAMAVLTIVYTSMGGLRAVVLTDVIQTFILFGAALLAIILINIKMGGPANTIPDQWPNHWVGFKFYDPYGRASLVTAALSIFSWYKCTAGSDQIAIQRYLATRNIKSARRMFLASLTCFSLTERVLVQL